MKIIFFGTPKFASDILEYLIDQKINIVAVVTQSDKKRGNISPVKQIAERKIPNVEVFQPEKATDPAFIEEIKKFTPALFVVVAYGKILRPALLAIPTKGSINVHASLLPKYRGAAPIQRAIMEGEKKTGITIMEMSEGLDCGDIIAQKEVPIDEKMDFSHLHDELCNTAKPLLLEVIKDFEKGKIKKYPQDNSRATFAPKITIDDQEIDFSKEAFVIYNQIRALSPSPGARCTLEINGERKKMKIIECEKVDLKGEPKEILKFEKNDFIIACKKNSISIKKLQIEGKNIMSAAELIRGMKKSFKII